ncbi:MAG: hypothetical protein KA239_00290 [Bacteroidia bacterium]|nr:hypothetical protein [Bacteroidia bacterium]
MSWIIAARSSNRTKVGNHYGTVPVPVGYSDKMTRKDKIILAVADATRPLHVREIIPILKSWESKEWCQDIDSLMSVLLSQLVGDGALVRSKRNGKSRDLNVLPE